MKSGNKKILLVFVFMLGIISSIFCDQIKEGDIFPNLKEFNLEGDIPSLEGKLVLIDFWASWCGPCKKSFPELENIYNEYKEKGFVLIGINVDQNPNDMEKFLKKNQVSFIILRDKDQKLVEKCGINALPSSFMIKNGEIISVHNGFHAGKTGEQIRKEIKELL
ncbi:MAG: Redoxin superfamily [uncultured bacterium]|nr:MAG: Redoxin superfamily [uncultured bacterium]